MKKILTVLLTVFILMPASAIESVDVLTDDDAARYAQIFLLQDKEKVKKLKEKE